MQARQPWPYADAFEREIQAFLRVFPEFAEECPVMDVPEFGQGPQRCLTAKGAFGVTV